MEYQNLWQALYPRLDAEISELIDGGNRYIQYTSAENAFHIIKNQNIWLRNVRHMNDRSEMNHGIKSLELALKDDGIMHALYSEVDSVHPGIVSSIFNELDSASDLFRYKTYIACVSVHTPEDEKYGRLSMWRAYGGNTPVGLIFKPDVILGEDDFFNTYLHPVKYTDYKGVQNDLLRLINVLKGNQNLIRALDRERVQRHFVDYFRTHIICTKHEAFREEREWRAVYDPINKPSKFVEREYQVIGGIPQDVHKLPLRNLDEIKNNKLNITDFLDEIIIGPCGDAEMVRMTLYELLYDIGGKKPKQKFTITGVPLRN